MKNLLIFLGVVFICVCAIYFPIEKAHGWAWASLAAFIFEFFVGIVFLILLDDDFFYG